MQAAFTDFRTFATFVINTVLNPLIPVLVAAAVTLFLYGVFLFVVSAGNAAARDKGRLYIIYGLIGLFVMLSVWGLVGVLTGTFGLPVGIPQFAPGQGGGGTLLGN